MAHLQRCQVNLAIQEMAFSRSLIRQNISIAGVFLQAQKPSLDDMIP